MSNTASLTVVLAPSLVFLKTVSVLNDPFNGTTSPKNIPDANVLYNLRVTNTGAGTVDANMLIITDPIPGNTAMFVGDLGAVNSGPILFVQGSPTSGLAYTFSGLPSGADDVDFFSDIACATPLVPVPPYDANVKCIRLNPKGTMSGGGSPYFELRFKVQIK